MKANKENEVHLGDNVKYLMRAFQITQAQLADKMSIPDSQLCNLLQKAIIEDAMLLKIADAIGYGVSAEMIKNYNHDDTISYIINNYNQNIEDGGNGTLIPNQDNSTTSTSTSTFEKGSQPTINHLVAEQAFAYAEKNIKLEKLLLYYRMKVEPDVVEKEMISLKKEYNPEQD